MELLEKLAALVPPPRVNLVRYHGVLAPHARNRDKIVPAKADEVEEAGADDSKDAPFRRRNRIGGAALEVGYERVAVLGPGHEPALLGHLGFGRGGGALRERRARGARRAGRTRRERGGQQEQERAAEHGDDYPGPAQSRSTDTGFGLRLVPLHRFFQLSISPFFSVFRLLLSRAIMYALRVVRNTAGEISR